MSDNVQVSIDELTKISLSLVSKYFVTQDIYSLLALSLLTVTTHFFKKRKLTSETRINLAITFIPDLVPALISNKILTRDKGEDLLRLSHLRREELSSILHSYIVVSAGLKAYSFKKNQSPNKRTGCFKNF
jgi:hypothetical protein